ncbi:MAG: PBECR4 domain-containing protein [Clostridia bacterium]|jgi:hypothetical protein|nr:PBECR4 domain-containing protein [Clostridia bacterium]
MKLKRLTKNEVLPKVIECANLYKSNLLNKNMLIICYDNKNKKYSYMETAFLDKHFVHLTGIKIRPSKGATTYNPNVKSEKNFFHNCINHRTQISDFELPTDGTVELKMQVLSKVINFINSNNMMGSFGHRQNHLITEKLVGNIYGCMGFVKDTTIDYYIPNTVLKKDIRDITNESNSIICIFERNISENCYGALCYLKAQKSKKVKDKKTGLKTIIQPINHYKYIRELDFVINKVSSDLLN